MRGRLLIIALTLLAYVLSRFGLAGWRTAGRRPVRLNISIRSSIGGESTCVDRFWRLDVPALCSRRSSAAQKRSSSFFRARAGVISSSLISHSPPSVPAPTQQSNSGIIPKKTVFIPLCLPSPMKQTRAPRGRGTRVGSITNFHFYPMVTWSQSETITNSIMKT